MFHTGGEEDDAEFNITSTGGSKLASLFSLEQASKEQSLTYSAPKQPKKTETSSGAQASVLFAVAVHVYKLVEQQYTNQGKLGAAIVGSHEAFSYKLLLYKGQQQPQAVATIGSSFDYKVQNNKYATFYDDRKENWSILFESDENSIEFAKQIALARCNSMGSNLNLVIMQDLTLGEGGAINIGDSAEIRYTGWVLTENTFGKVFDSNVNSDRLFRIKLGKAKVIKGWEEGLIGAKRNMQRLLIIPPSLGYGSQGVPEKIPPNAVLIFEVFVNKVKFAKDSRPDTPSSTSKPVQQSESSSNMKIREHTDSIRNPNDDSVKARGASISEQFTQSPKSEKAKIISRMAKMGMPMLPMQGAVIAQPSSESENEDELQRKRSLTVSPAREPSPKPIVRPRPIVPNIAEISSGNHPASMHHATQSHQMTVFQPQYPSYAYPLASNQPLAMFPQVQPNLDSPHLPILISETRAQNSEVRMALGKITDKVEAVLSKLEQSKSESSRVQSSIGSVSYMDASALQQNIDRIVQENLKWKADLDNKNSKITILNEKICELLERNQKLVEESNMLMEKRSDTFQSSTAQSHTRLLNLEQEKVRLTTDLSQAYSQVADLKLEMQRLQNNVQRETASSSANTSRYEESINLLQKKDSLVSDLESQLRISKDDSRLLSDKIAQLEDQVHGLQSSNSLLKKDSYKSRQEFEEEKEKAEKILEDLKNNHRKELERLQTRLLETTSALKEDKTVDSSSSIELNANKEQVSALKRQNAELRQRILQLENSEHFKIPQLEAKLKKAMTTLYRSLQKEISGENKYQGNEILQALLQKIRVVTIAMLEAESEEQREKMEKPISNNLEPSTPVEEDKTNATKLESETVTVEDDKVKENDLEYIQEETETEVKGTSEEIEPKIVSLNPIVDQVDSGTEIVTTDKENITVNSHSDKMEGISETKPDNQSEVTSSIPKETIENPTESGVRGRISPNSLKTQDDQVRNKMDFVMPVFKFICALLLCLLVMEIVCLQILNMNVY